jgi:hypothetical protein
MFFVLLLITTQSYAQATLTFDPKENLQPVNQVKIGGLILSHFKISDAKVQSLVQIIFKNEKYIYEQESDTIDIIDTPQLNLLIKDLKEGLSIIEDDQKTANFTGKDYILVKNNINLDNKLLIFYNKDYNISQSINKSTVLDLIDWLEAIKF